METQNLQSILKEYTTISLDQLNASMSFLERIEAKYLLNLKQLDKLLGELQDSFYVLNIKDVSIFTYDNIYMDTKDYLFYKQHEQGEKQRLKVRTRHYVDSGDLVYFEMKLKEKKLLRKFRYPTSLEAHGQMNKDAVRFYTSIAQSLGLSYAKEQIFPSIETRYKRITLCSKESDERLTIDFDVELNDMRDNAGRWIKLGNIAIVESKARTEDGHGRKVMKKLKIKEAHGCSKYCLGIHYFGRMHSHDRFKKTIEFIDKHHMKEITTVNKVQSKLASVKKEVHAKERAIANKMKEKNF